MFVLVALFVAWFAVSALNQFRAGALTARLRRQIPLGLIPLWTFFAPNPARADSRLIWREEVDGRWQHWRELQLGFGSWRTRWLVHPQLMSNKAIADLVNSLLRTDAGVDDRSTVLSSSYVTLLSIVSDRSTVDRASAVQFAIVRTSKLRGRREVALAFVSEAHEVSDGSDRFTADPAREDLAHVR